MDKASPGFHPLRYCKQGIDFYAWKIVECLDNPKDYEWYVTQDGDYKKLSIVTHTPETLTGKVTETVELEVRGRTFNDLYHNVQSAWRTHALICRKNAKE